MAGTMTSSALAFAHKAEMFVEAECADEVIDKSTDFAVGG
jgi:hypothetical protein